MYTGIVQAMLPISSTRQRTDLLTFGLKLPHQLQTDLALGASIAINGCCFTVTTMTAEEVVFDAIAETLQLTNINN